MFKQLPLLFCISGCLLTVGAVRAQQSVSVAVGVERIENPLLSSTSPGGATVLRVQPIYSLEKEGDRTRSRIYFGAIVERSSNTALVASRDYPSLGYAWSYSWPTSSLELRADLAESTTRNTELEELGRVTADSRERSVVAGGRWSQELTDRTQLALDLANTRVRYDSVLLSGYRELQFSGRVSREASETLVYYFEPAISRLATSGVSTETTLRRWLFGLRGELVSGWSFTSTVGQARTSEQLSGSINVASLLLTYAGDRLTSAAELSRDVVPSAATRTYVGAEVSTFRLGYRITEGATLSASVTHSRSGGAEGSRGRLTSVSLENALGSQWSTALGIEDRRTWLFGGASGSGTAIRATLLYAYPGR
jgi:hypothetical protein